MPARIAVITYSLWSHIDQLTPDVAAGAREAVDVFRFPEILSPAALLKLDALPPAPYPEAHPADLAQYDGFLLGFGTRFDGAPAAVRAWMDRTGGIWSRGEWAGKFGGAYTGASSQHGGHEVTLMTVMPFFIHHGMPCVFPGYTSDALYSESEVGGGSAWGASFEVAPTGARTVTAADKRIAFAQGAVFGQVVGAYVAGLGRGGE